MIRSIRENRYVKWASNKFVLAGVPFLVWMIFFDANSYFMQRELDREIDKLNQSISFYSSELEHDREELRELESNPKAFEKYAREKFWMHKKGETLYVFDFQDD